MSLRQERHRSRINSKPVVLGISLFGVGVVSFLFVWWPIQAERMHKSLNEWDKQCAQKKSEVTFLKTQLSQMTSLTVLDAWSKKHGPWKIPNHDEIIIIEK